MTDLEFFLDAVGDRGGGHTIGQFIEGVAKQVTVADARRFFAGHVAWFRDRDDVVGEPEDIARQNIGYVTGYFGDSERKRVGRLFVEACGAYHPVFGDPTRDISPEEAFELGKGLAKGGGSG